MTIKFQVSGRTKQGALRVYTGKAGEAFVSPFTSEAFLYDSLEAARHRATILNQGTPLHGIHFIAIDKSRGRA